MIGGVDIILNSKTAAEDVLRQAFSLTRRVWPKAVVEDGSEAEGLLEISFPLDAFLDKHEILIYKDLESFNSWSELGADPSNTSTMIHVLAHKDIVTLVVDDPTDPIVQQVILGMKAFLENDIFHITAESESRAAA